LAGPGRAETPPVPQPDDPEAIVQVGEDPERSTPSFQVLPVFEDLTTGSAAGPHEALGDANA